MHVLPLFIASSVAHEYEENRLPRECDDHASTTTTRLRLLCEHDCCCVAAVVADGDEQLVNVGLIKGLAQSGHLDIDIGGARRGSECFDPAQVEFSIDKWADRFARSVFDGCCRAKAISSSVEVNKCVNQDDAAVLHAHAALSRWSATSPMRTKSMPMPRAISAPFVWPIIAFAQRCRAR